MFVVYVLRSNTTGRRYTGCTSDFVRRLQQHNSDISTSTKNRGPWEVIHREEYSTLAEAMRREKHLKTGHGRAELEQLLTDPGKTLRG